MKDVLVLVFGLFMPQCAQSLELMAKENSKLSLRRSKVFKKKTVEYLRATPLALLPFLLKMSDRLVLIVCVMFKIQDFLCNDLESIYVLNKLRVTSLSFLPISVTLVKKSFFFVTYLLQAFHWSTDIFWTPKKIYARTSILPFNVKCKFILKQYFIVTQTMDLKWLTHSCEKQDTHKHFKKINGCLQ